MRFQQLTGPVMAKGVEDTAFYRFHRLVSLNEVGGNPERIRPQCRRLPPPECRAPAAVALVAVHDVDARHQARRGRPCPDQCPVGDPRRMAAAGARLAPPEPKEEAETRRRPRPRPQRRVPPLPNAGRRLADGAVAAGRRPRLHRADPGLHAQGAAGGEGPRELDQEPKDKRRRQIAAESRWRRALFDARQPPRVRPGPSGPGRGAAQSKRTRTRVPHLSAAIHAPDSSRRPGPRGDADPQLNRTVATRRRCGVRRSATCCRCRASVAVARGARALPRTAATPVGVGKSAGSALPGGSGTTLAAPTG